MPECLPGTYSIGSGYNLTCNECPPDTICSVGLCTVNQLKPELIAPGFSKSLTMNVHRAPRRFKF